ncbi:uncharacterized protein LOC125501289 isoform X2 [Athalia rosae]|uniref:uncharacterized protein LOC125501289 isoform X2 n=1 Tax=Athalia rosae TaxID=37344 RepID=UPI0020343D56|nr:uncharacterized protein LOC125501289 isoform X2 [Athalia rosae]
MMEPSENTESVAQFVDPHFIKRYEVQLDAKIAALESSIEEAEANNATFKENIRTKHAIVKEMKNKIVEREKSLVERKKNLDSMQCINNELAEHTAMLKADADKYEQETAVIAAGHTEVLNNAHIKWETYKKNYERLPHVMARIKEDIKLKQSKIHLGMKRYKLEELKKQIAQRIAIDEMRRNRSIIECAVLRDAGKIGDAKLRGILDTQNELKKALALQEITIETLKKQKKDQSAQKCTTVTSATKIKVDRVLDFGMLNIPRLEIPRGITPGADLSSIPILDTCLDNADNVSMSSTLFAELLEPINVRDAKTNAERLAAVPPGLSSDKIENFRSPSTVLPPQNYRIGEKSSVAAEIATGDQKTTYGNKIGKPEKSTAGQHVISEEKEVDEEAFDYPLSGKLAQEPPAPFEKDLARRVNEGEATPVSRNLPQITDIENVKIILPPRTPVMQYMAPSSIDNSAYSVEFNPNSSQPPSNFTEGPSSPTGLGDADYGSMFLESETSQQSEDMIKKLRIMFSPRSRNYNNLERQASPTEKEPPRDGISHTNIAKPQTAGNPGIFGDMTKFGTSAVNPDKKKEPLFLNMFR